MDWLELLSDKRPGETTKAMAGNSLRSNFEQDYDRIIFSYPFRMLQDKTQVFPLPKHDFVHTRLTHSLEVSSVGRSLGKKAGQQIITRHPQLKQNGFSAYDFGAIVAAGSLTHDLGNPPFGHSGEDALSDFFKNNEKAQVFKPMLQPGQWQDLLSFEGNAQGFRILNKQQYQGLKLTCATLAAFTKYPRQSLILQADPQRKSQKKYGFYQSEKDIFSEVADAVGLITINQSENTWCRHPLAFLVEAADDICYHIIDLEDGCNAGLVSYRLTEELLGSLLGDQFKPDKLKKVAGIREKVGLLRALCIGKLIDQCTEVLLDHEADLLNGSFDQALTEIIPLNQILKEIINISIEKIYRSDLVLDIEIAGFDVLEGLLEAFTLAIFRTTQPGQQPLAKDKTLLRLLPEEYKAVLDQETNIYILLRHCLDFVSGLTDSHAINLYRKIKGI